MKRVPVKSSNVASVGYDPETKTLEVEFHNGNIYQYFDVPQNVYENLIRADSIGKFLNTQIKDNYRYTKV